MAKVAIDKTPPVWLEKCRKCGGEAKLHHSRSGKWYVRCTWCKKENKTEESVSKLSICKVWNVRNKVESHRLKEECHG